MKLIPEDFLTWESFKALWHVLGAQRLSRLAVRAPAMPWRCFTLQWNAWLRFLRHAAGTASALPAPPPHREEGTCCLLMYLYLLPILHTYLDICHLYNYICKKENQQERVRLQGKPRVQLHEWEQTDPSSPCSALFAVEDWTSFLCQFSQYFELSPNFLAKVDKNNDN